MQSCENCNYQTEVEDYDGHLFCEVCSHTYLSRATTTPREVDVRLYKSLAWIANRIIDLVKPNDKEVSTNEML